MASYFEDANIYPWSIQSIGSFLAILLSKLLTSLVQSIIKYSEFPCSQNLRVHVSKVHVHITTSCFLLSDLARAITGEILHVDAGYHAMAGALRDAEFPATEVPATADA